jgi:hypothetical protein
MNSWQRFDDPRFALQFRYPGEAADGEAVARVETEQAGMLRVHVLAPICREVYFEVTKYDALSAESKYQRHKASLPNQFDPLVISELRETVCASLSGYEYTFEWDQGRRVVLLVERENATYRILYNPGFPVNLKILSTLEWISLL